MKCYNKGYVLINGSLCAVDCTHLEGIRGVVAEVFIRIAFGKTTGNGHFLSRSAFRRMCKRHNCSQTEARQFLRDAGLITPQASFSYGTFLLSVPPRFQTVETWNKIGCLVHKGETSYVRNEDGKALFHTLQVVRILN